jgi:preprotein translocase subunit SecA
MRKIKKVFYNILDVSVADNADKTVYIKGTKSCYKMDVVYGDVSQFQFDTLRDEYNALGTLGGRDKQVVIVDEVDSMLIDDSSKIAQLSANMPGMEHLEHIYHAMSLELDNLYSRLYRDQSKDKLYYMAGNVAYNEGKVSLKLFATGEVVDLEDHLRRYGMSSKIGREIPESYIKEHLQDCMKNVLQKGDLKIPVHLQGLIDCQLSRWARHAIAAKALYKERVDYIVGEDEHLIKRVKPVDYDSTGVVQGSTHWSDGLHQFLQIKHGLQVTPETLTTNFLSNKGYFAKYITRDAKQNIITNNIYGLTGTLGSERAKAVLTDTYEIDHLNIPSLREKQYVEYAPILTSTEDEWSKAVVNSVIKESRKKEDH